MNKAVQSVIDVHTLIENIFTGNNLENDLGDLLAHFDDNFAMVTINGDRIGLAQVASLFTHNIGTRSSLKIKLHDINLILESSNYCWVQYQEQHQTQDGDTLRISTACIRIEEERCFWVYLHETPVRVK